MEEIAEEMMVTIAASPRTSKASSSDGDAEGKMYAGKLGELLNTERKVIAFHLNALKKAGLVISEFGLSQDERPVALRYYKITPKGKEILRKLISIRTLETC